MARNRNLRSLYRLSLIQVCNLIIYSSKAIHDKYGSPSSAKLIKQLHFVQRFILSHIHPQFLDEIVQTFDRLTSYIWLDNNDPVKSSILAVCMHSRMKYFKPSFQLPVNDELYISHLKGMNHLRCLNLSMVCSDEILKIVGRSCPLLEFIDITSKVESATNSAIRFNALKLRFFISDKGLKYLHQCKRLQRIVMNSVIRSNCGGRKISICGIKKLLLNLDMLKYINYQDMGLVLKEISCQEIKHGALNLVHLQDNHVSTEHINLFTDLCPKLQRLSLCIPQTNPQQELSDSCLELLSNNPLRLSSIDLWFFKSNQYMLNFFASKGKYLTSLSLKDCSDVNTNLLIEICNYCPNLKILKMNLLKPSDFGIQITKDNYFKHLEELNLSGSQWDFDLIFNLCIYKSYSLKILSLCNKHIAQGLDPEIKLLLLRNPLLDLTEIEFLQGCKISFPFLKQFLMHCKNLDKITVIDDREGSITEDLINFISSRKFDISMAVSFERNR